MSNREFPRYSTAAELERQRIQQRYERHTALYIWALIMASIAGTCLAFIVQ